MLCVQHITFGNKDDTPAFTASLAAPVISQPARCRKTCTGHANDREPSLLATFIDVLL